MPSWVIAFLVRYVLPSLVEFFFAFLKNLTAARADDPAFLDVAQEIVSGIGRDHFAWTDEQKRAFAFDAIKQRAMDLGKDIGDSLINTLIELAVQRVKGASRQ